MNRRDLIKWAGLAGLTAFLPTPLSRSASAQAATWGGPYFLHMHADGGWDPTLFCDGKITAPGTSPDYQNRIVTSVAEVNGVPVPEQGPEGRFLLRNRQGNVLEDPLHFFEKLGQRVLVINGLDTQTNNHETGVQGAGCGHNDVELPALAALFAGQVIAQRTLPLAFLAHGVYNRTGDVVTTSRFPGDKAGVLADPFRPGDDEYLVSELAARRINELRLQRVRDLAARPNLPRGRRTVAAMAEATNGGGALTLLKELAASAAPPFESLVEHLPPDAVEYMSQKTGSGLERFVDLGRQVEIMLRCFKEGVTASATLAQGGFDTHSDHDINQSSALGSFVARVRYALLRAEQLGIADKTYILVTSDFGRTPTYNSGNGKDHWNISSALLVGPGVRGGRVIGGTDEGQKALRVQSGNPNVTLEAGDLSGTRIVPQHVHAELRRVLGLEQAPFIGGFPLPSTDEKLALLA